MSLLAIATAAFLAASYGNVVLLNGMGGAARRSRARAPRPGHDRHQGAGPAYYLSFRRYDGIATARSLPRPILILQGERDYQVTVRDDLALWQKGLAGRKRVRIVRFPAANHFFLDGSGLSTPLEYSMPGRVDPKVAATVAAWIASQSD